MNALEIAGFLHNIDGDDPNLRACVFSHSIDALACLCAGVMTREGADLLKFYANAGAGADDRASVASASAAIIRYTEWDAINVPSCATPDAFAVPTALMFASDEAAFVRAVAAGHVVGLALCTAIGGVDALPETWPGLFAAPAVAAVSSAMALELGPDLTAQALVIAMAGTSGRNGRPTGSPSSRWLSVGEATLKGIRAALAARAGVRGDLALLSADWMKGQGRAAGGLGVGMFDKEAIMRVELKPFVAARQGMNAISAFRRLIADGLDPATIKTITVRVPKETIAVSSRELVLGDRLSTIAHLGLQLGVAAFEPERLSDVARTRPFLETTLSLAGKVAMKPLEVGVGGAGWPAEVVVKAGANEFEAASPEETAQDPITVSARKLSALPSDLAGRLQRIEGQAAESDFPLRNARSLLQEVVAMDGLARTDIRPEKFEEHAA
ncbi:hypothetical protein [Aliihoeflea sp. PC F10.4]